MEYSYRLEWSSWPFHQAYRYPPASPVLIGDRQLAWRDVLAEDGKVLYFPAMLPSGTRGTTGDDSISNEMFFGHRALPADPCDLCLARVRLSLPLLSVSSPAFRAFLTSTHGGLALACHGHDSSGLSRNARCWQATIMHGVAEGIGVRAVMWWRLFSSLIEQSTYAFLHP